MEKAATTACLFMLILLLQSADAFLPMAHADISLRFVPGCSPKGTGSDRIWRTCMCVCVCVGVNVIY
jgi:hypothetical protein